MNSQTKTPDFDKAINAILDKLEPHQRKCRQCRKDFKVYREDIAFYRKMMVPPPTLCPDCRMQRRMGFYNNVLKFYKKECSVHPGEKVISTFYPESPYKIFDSEYWWSINWGGEEYGRDYDSSKLFFEQFRDLNLTVPHSAITHYWKGVVNSPYTIAIINAKNCYLSALANYIENVHYSYWAIYSKDCLDSLNFARCENCYELTNCSFCYDCQFCEDCDNCIGSLFLRDCKNCFNCFACVNLRHKSYCFFNEQLTKEEYERKIKEINLGDREVLEEYGKKFREFAKKSLRRNLFVDRKNTNCFGDLLEQAKNCYLVFRGDYGVENLRYCADVSFNIKDSMDLWDVAPNVNLSYELVECFNSSLVKFSYFIRDGLNLEYCLECFNCRNCFGCIGLRHKQFHIFNKPYLEDDYWQKLNEIKIKMLENNEYGEFFPLSMSLYPYNNSYAVVEFPLNKEQVLKNGWQWYDEPHIPPDLLGLAVIEPRDLPVDIKEVKDDILDKAVVCRITGKPFRIIKPELDFYRKHNLPIPTKHPFQRMLERFRKRNPLKLWKAVCAKCGNEIYTSYFPEKQKEYKIYCENCYLKEVI